MKYASTIRRFAALAAVAAAVSTPMGAHAESKHTQGSGTLSASAKLDFEIVVEKFIFLQVGTGAINADNATVDKQTFTVSGIANGNGTVVPANGAPLTAAVRGNTGFLSLSNNGSGNLTNGSSDTIAISKLAPVQTGDVPHGAWGSTATLPLTTGASNVTKLDGTWTFNYLNDAVVAAGTYSKTVTYTLTSV